MSCSIEHEQTINDDVKLVWSIDVDADGYADGYTLVAMVVNGDRITRTRKLDRHGKLDTINERFWESLDESSLFDTDAAQEAVNHEQALCAKWG